MVRTDTGRRTEVVIGTELAPLRFDVSYTTMAKDVAGTRDIYPIHHDPAFAAQAGARSIFLNTMWYQGMLGRYATDWGGPESFVRRLSFQMRAPNCPGDSITVRGTVVATSATDDEVLVELDIRIDNQDQPDTVTARLVLGLPLVSP